MAHIIIVFKYTTMCVMCLSLGVLQFSILEAPMDELCSLFLEGR